ncbi:MAG: hypothetical protein EOL92_07565 [Bacteroidia bacterium]|nr:hypothetical protein [Bacteroidia bacterium]
MSYLSHLQSILGNQATVTEELAYQYSGEGILVIVKYLSGTNYRDSVVQPIQLAIYTDDVPTTRTLFESFAKTYNNTPYTDGLDYIQQIYSTPMVLSTFQPTGTNFTSQLIVSGTLIISSNVSDIKSVTIDGVAYETTSRVLTYVAMPNNKRDSTAKLNKTKITMASLKFNCTLINKSNTLNTKIRNLRTGALDIDTTFTVALEFNDGPVTETYIMRLDSYTVNSENQILPTLSLSFIL